MTDTGLVCDPREPNGTDLLVGASLTSWTTALVRSRRNRGGGDWPSPDVDWGGCDLRTAPSVWLPEHDIVAYFAGEDGRHPIRRATCVAWHVLPGAPREYYLKPADPARVTDDRWLYPWPFDGAEEGDP